MSSVQNLHQLADTLKNRENILVNEVNDHCLRLAVNQDATYDWHHHPNSDELFVVLDGELTIEFPSANAVVLRTGDFFTVPSKTVHRTIARGKTVNLCLESTHAETVFGLPEKME